MLLLAISNVAAIGSGKLHRGHWRARRGGGRMRRRRARVDQAAPIRTAQSVLFQTATITLNDTQSVQVCPLLAFHVRPPLLPPRNTPTVSPFCSLSHKVILLLPIAIPLPHTHLPDSPRGSCSNVIDVTRTILSRAASTLSQGAKGKSSYTSTSIVAMSICSPSNASCNSDSDSDCDRDREYQLIIATAIVIVILD